MPPSTRERRLTWELAEGWPYQGDWTVEQYLRLDTDRAVEFVDGFLEFLPTPTETHQDIIEYIYLAVKAVLQRRGQGVAKFAPFKVRIGDSRFREPDVCALLDAADPRRGHDFWGAADLVVEVVSPDDPQRDYEEKRTDYALAGIGEYWIVDPQKRTVTLLELAGKTYVPRGEFNPGQSVSSKVLDGFVLNVSDCFAAANNVAPNRMPLEPK